jgi:hypothetical protein
VAGLRKKEQWFDHSQAMLEGTSLAKAAERCGVHPTRRSELVPIVCTGFREG